MLIDSFARGDDFPALKLVIVGEGELRAAMERQIEALGLQDRVRLHGTEADPLTMYSAFDVVAQSSFSEGLPNVLLEAGAVGRPIVATDAGGSRTGQTVLKQQTAFRYLHADVPFFGSQQCSEAGSQ